MLLWCHHVITSFPARIDDTRSRFSALSARTSLNVTTVLFEIKFTTPFLLQDLGCFVINLLKNKTIILLNLAEYHLILADEAYGLVG